MTVKNKLFLCALLIAATQLAIFSLVFGLNNQSHAITDALLSGNELQHNMTIMRHNEQLFLLNKQLKDAEKVSQAANDFSLQLDQLTALLKGQWLQGTGFAGFGDETLENKGFSQTLRQLDNHRLAYQGFFKALVKAQQQIGLDPKSGLYGTLRHAAHDAEEQLAALGDETALILLLQLRRAEKDFMLRHTLKYQTKFNTIFARLTAHLDGADPALLNALLTYQLDFKRLVSAQQQLGLEPQSGLRSQLSEAGASMQADFLLLINQLNHFADQTNIQTDWQRDKISLILLLSVVLVFVAIMLELIRQYRDQDATSTLSMGQDTDENLHLYDQANEQTAQLTKVASQFKVLPAG